MATATEMTLTLGRTVYGGDPSGDADRDERMNDKINEKIEGRETRVSVTWRLTEAEQNLPLMASVLAEEAERVLTSADRTVRRHPQTEVKAKEVETEHTQRLTPLKGIPANGAPAGTGSHLSDTGSRPGQRFTTGSASSTVQPASETPRESNSPAPGNGYGTSGPSPSSPSYSRTYVPGIPKPSITKTQQLAIQSHCTRHGVADWELRKLIWERFGKKEQRELNKDEAGELLTALQQAMLSNRADHNNGADHPAYAN